MKNFIGSRNLPKLNYHHPGNVQQALDMLYELGEKGRVIAGCTDFIPAVRRGAWSFDDGLDVIDIGRLAELKNISLEDGVVKIGTAATLTEIARSTVIQAQAPGLADAIIEMASAQVRNTGTIGGNICTASPAGDTIPPLLALNAKVKVAGIGQEKIVPLAEFFKGPGQTILGPKEMLTEIQFPALKPNEKFYRVKLGRRKSFTCSVISMAIWAKSAGGIIEDVRIALGAVAPTPIRARRAEEYLIGKKVSDQVIEEGARIASGEVSPISDVRASADYRKDMACTLTRRGLTQCLDLRGSME